MVDEATDVAHTKQLNLSICWANDDYEVHEILLGCAACLIHRQKVCLQLSRVFSSGVVLREGLRWSC